MKCPNPECVNGKVTIEKPVSMNSTASAQVDCDVCGGTGVINEDILPPIIERLDRIIELLKAIKNSGGK